MEGRGRREKKKEGLSPEEVAVKAKAWPKCTFWVEKKQRFCRLQKMSDKQLVCTEHLPIHVIVEGEGGQEWERIPCPVDPKHTCFKHLLVAHVHKCNSVEPPLPRYIQKRVNYYAATERNHYEGLGCPSPAPLDKKEEMEYSTVEELSNDHYSKLLMRIVHDHHACQMNPANEMGLSPIVAAELCRSDIGENASRHLAQIGSILHLLENNGLLRDNTAFIEYGGGRGTVTYHLALLVKQMHLKKCKFYVIDKASPRHKQDNKLADLGIDVTRIRADIEDVLIGELPGIDDQNILRIVGVAKHLCGRATDMSLISLFKSNALCGMVSGFCFATCCHHQCELNSFAGKGFLYKKNLFTASDIRVLAQISSWATCGDFKGRIDDGKRLTELAAVYLESMEKKYPKVFLRNTIGNLAKDILDYGRAKYASCYFNGIVAEVVNFTDQSTTVENRAIIGSTNCSLERDTDYRRMIDLMQSPPDVESDSN